MEAAFLILGKTVERKWGRYTHDCWRNQKMSENGSPFIPVPTTKRNGKYRVVHVVHDGIFSDGHNHHHTQAFLITIKTL